MLGLKKLIKTAEEEKTKIDFRLQQLEDMVQLLYQLLTPEQQEDLRKKLKARGHDSPLARYIYGPIT